MINVFCFSSLYNDYKHVYSDYYVLYTHTYTETFVKDFDKNLPASHILSEIIQSRIYRLLSFCTKYLWFRLQIITVRILNSYLVCQYLIGTNIIIKTCRSLFLICYRCVARTTIIISWNQFLKFSEYSNWSVHWKNWNKEHISVSNIFSAK